MNKIFHYSVVLIGLLLLPSCKGFLGEANILDTNLSKNLAGKWEVTHVAVVDRIILPDTITTKGIGDIFEFDYCKEPNIYTCPLTRTSPNGVVSMYEYTTSAINDPPLLYFVYNEDDSATEFETWASTYTIEGNVKKDDEIFIHSLSGNVSLYYGGGLIITLQRLE